MNEPSHTGGAQTRRVRAGLPYALLAVVFFVVLALSSFAHHAGAPFVSSELKFTDASMHGLSIVPASCPSNPYDADAPNGCSGFYPLCPNGSPAPGGNVALCGGSPSGSPGGTPNGCPAGYTSSGGGCVFTGCPAGYTAQTQCSGPSFFARGGGTGCFGGQTTQCVFTGCPAGYTLQGSQCVLIARSCVAGYICSGSNLYYQSASCGQTLSRVCQFGCGGGACLTPPPPTATLTVTPSIVKRLTSTQVSWSTQNVVVGSCAVNGTNGDTWGGASGTKTSGQIPAQTVYTLTCTGLDNSSVHISKTVNIVPGFCETGAPGCN